MSFFNPSSLPIKPNGADSKVTLTSSLPLITAPTPHPHYVLLELPKELLARITDQQKNFKPSGLASRVGASSSQDQGQDRGANRDKKRKNIDPEAEGEGEGKGQDELCLTINGRFKDDAVLSTSDKTYSIRQVSQSNSLLLCSTTDPSSKIVTPDQASPSPSEEGKGDEEVEEVALQLNSTVSSIMELLLIPPRLERITTLLSVSAYGGKEEEEARLEQERKQRLEIQRLPKRRRIEIQMDPRHRLYTPREVRSVVQASEKELQQGFKERNVVELDGYLRLISPSHLSSILQHLLNHVSINSYLTDQVPLDSTIGTLTTENDFREEIVRKILTCWFGKVKEVGEADGETHGANEKGEGKGKGKGKEKMVELNEEEIVRFLGRRILQSRKQPSPLSAMMDDWKKSVGDFLEEKVNLELLKGHYLLTPSLPDQPTFSSSSSSSGGGSGGGGDSVKIQSFSKSHLPLEPAARFQELFLTKPQWVRQDLEPFITDLATDRKKLDALLLKFARVSQVKILLPRIEQEGEEEVAKEVAKGKGIGIGIGKRKRNTKEWKEISVYSARIKY